ncbi:MAG: serine--tRNA ligase [Kiritimatiellia bacterium]
MLDIKRIREKTDEVREGLRARGSDPNVIDIILAKDLERRQLLQDAESRKNERNRLSKEIGMRRKQGEDTSETQAEVRALGNAIDALDEQVKAIETEQELRLLSIPNIPGPHTLRGKDANDNRVARTWGTLPAFDFTPKSHIELGEALGILDFARATRMTGAGFPLLKGAGAKLQRALIQFMLDLHVTEHGYTELLPPFVVNSKSMTGTGQLPKMQEDMYHIESDDLWLIPTAEVPVTNYYREEIIDQPLPIYLTAYTPCFRREAGAAGRNTRGMIRVHQFDKVEMVKFVEPSTSYTELEVLTANAEDVLQRLELPYRVLELCSGDISFAAAKCYDLELWAPGQQEWLEVSSCSNFEDFQARRAGIRYRDADGKPQFVHTLNGSGVALPRLMIAIIENGQQADGSIILPQAIVSYMGGQDRISV